MATSSIFADFNLTDPKKIEEFTDAYIEAMEKSDKPDNNPIKPLLTDIEAIRKLMANGELK